MRLLYDNLADWARLDPIASYWEATLPLSNLARKEREKVARTVAPGHAEFAIEMIPPEEWITGVSSPQPISAVILYGANFGASDTWRVRIYEDNTQVNLVYDSDWQYASAPKTLGDLNFGIDPLGITLFTDWGLTFSTLWFPTVYGGYVRIETSTLGILDMARLFIGEYWEPSNMPIAGMSFGYRDTSQQFRTEGGTLHAEAGAVYRRLTLSGESMNESDRYHIERIQRVVGLRKDFYITMFPEVMNAYQRDHQMQGQLVDISEWTIPLYGRANQQFTIEEV